MPKFKLEFEIPVEVYRLVFVVCIASMIAGGVIFSRGGNSQIAVGMHGSELKFDQPKLSPGRFLPTPQIAEQQVDKSIELATAIPLPIPRPETPGFYYELMRPQGEDSDDPYEKYARPCVPGDMPEQCSLPERERENFPLRRE